ncbi:MAG: hypothetical protein AAF598_19280, partial [Bacteroidota bacterium]
MKHNRIDIGLLLLLFWGLLGNSSGLKGQGFVHYYNPTGPTRIDDAVALGNGHVLLLANLSYNGVFQPGLIYTDELGEIVWLKSGYHSLSSAAAALVKAPDGGFAFATLMEASSGNNDITLTKVNAAGDLEWQVIFEDEGVQEHYESLQLDGAGNFVLFGETGNFASESARIMKVDPAGNLLYDYVIPETTPDFTPLDFMVSSANEYVAVGHRRSNFNSAIDGNVYVKFDPNSGQVIDLIEFNHPNEGTESFFRIIEAPDGNYLTFGANTSFTANIGRFEIRKTDPSGNEIWTTFLDSSNAVGTQDIFIDDSHIMLGYNKSIGAQIVPRLAKMELDGSGVEWRRSYPDIGPASFQPYSYQSDGVGGYVITGVNFGAGMPFVGWAIRTDSAGWVFTNELTGKAYDDINETCNPDPGEFGIPGWPIRFEKNFPVYRWTDDFGEYSILLDTGTYSMELVTPSAYWQTCAVPDITLEDFFLNPVQDIGAFALVDCPDLQVAVGTNRLRRCINNTYAVSYCNFGTLPAINSFIEIELDPFLTYVSSTIPLTSQVGNTLTFDLGTVDLFECGSFSLTVFLDCDVTLGQTHCTEAHIFPDSICVQSSAWSGASIAVSGLCENDQTIEFEIENTGSGSMDGPLEYIVVEDEMILLQGQFDLDPGQIEPLSIPANGSTYRLIAQQEPDHPGLSFPNIAVEGCGGFGSTGLINNFPLDESDHFLSVDCTENVDSYDPNDKQVFPEGVGQEGFIEANRSLEYLIRFQNTGTDTAYRVVIRDTLSRKLDMEEFETGASSDPYTLDIRSAGDQV